MSRGNFNILMKPVTTGDGEQCYNECVMLFVDNVMTASHITLELIKELGR